MTGTAFALRAKPPTIRFANRGPRSAHPIPAPSGRPLTKGALLRSRRRQAEVHAP